MCVLELVDADCRRKTKILDSTRIDCVEGPGRFPVLDVAHLWTIFGHAAGFFAPIEKTAFVAADKGRGSAIRERAFRTRILLFRMRVPPAVPAARFGR